MRHWRRGFGGLSRTWSPIFAVIGLLSFSSDSSAQSQRPTSTTAYLKTLSLDELANIQVTSVSRKEQRASEAAAAVHVITEEDIRRSGARSIPEALRLAPNLQVARANSRSWAISARGFTAPFSNKLLVLIDGRSVYSPLFAGVFWDAQDTLLEDIDRIEVISGPGATMWGANAVNGVINIVTKSARDTRGFLGTAGGGTEERFFTGLRYGGSKGENVNFRLYAKYFDRAASLLETGGSAGDPWHSAQVGGRLDWTSGKRDAFTVQGDVYDVDASQLEAQDIHQAGGNLLARWTRTRSATERTRVQAYYDRTHQFAPGEFGDDLDTFDVDAQYERDVGARHHVMAGAGFRYSHDRIQNLPESIAFLPAELHRRLFSTFVQDDVTLVADRLELTLGSKFEHNDYTGLEVQPSGRMAWTPGRQAVWGAISRAVRTPSRFDRHLFFPAEPPFVVAGGPDFESEKLVAYELGWRATAPKSLVASLGAFFNDYDDVRSTSLGRPRVTQNGIEGEIYGAELAASWQVSPRWRVFGGYTLLRTHLRVKPGEEDLNAGQGEAFDPKHQFQVRSSFTLSPDIEIDGWTRYVGQIPPGRGFGVVPDYLTLDARVGWSPLPNVQIAIVGQNLLDARHLEFGTQEIRRAVYVKATWRSAAPK